jgi:tetratricopeptide (TPR) repeat protein
MDKVFFKKGLKKYKAMVYSFIFLLFFLWACDSDSCRDIFTLGPVKAVKSESVEELEERAKKYESQMNKKIESADSLGIVYQKLGDKYLERMTWTSAIESYEKAIGYGRSSPIVHYSLAVAYANRGRDNLSKGDINKAEYHYKKAIELSPDFYDAIYGLGILYAYAKDDKEKGLEIISNLVARNREYYIARFALARMYYESGDPSKALSVYEDLYSDLQKQKKSPQIEEYLEKCKANIERLMIELSGKR